MVDPREKGGSRNPTHVLAVEVGEADSSLGERVEVGGADFRIAVAAEGVGAEFVAVDPDDVGSVVHRDFFECRSAAYVRRQGGYTDIVGEVDILEIAGVKKEKKKLMMLTSLENL